MRCSRAVFVPITRSRRSSRSTSCLRISREGLSSAIISPDGSGETGPRFWLLGDGGRSEESGRAVLAPKIHLTINRWDRSRNPRNASLKVFETCGAGDCRIRKCYRPLRGLNGYLLFLIPGLAPQPLP